MPGFLKLVVENLIGFSTNFFSIYSKDLLDQKQIHFHWNHFDKEYFVKIIELNKEVFEYAKRKSRGFFKKRKVGKFDWTQKDAGKLLNNF